MSTNNELKPLEDYRMHRRNLPHWEMPGNAYFVSFNTMPGFDLNDKAKNITLDAIKYHNNKKYKLYACVIMDTHVHLIILPLEKERDTYFSLAQIMHSIKSYSANKLQRVIGKNGKIWLDENYDRIIRNDNDFFEKINYIMNNPVKAGMVEYPDDYQWLFYQGLD